MSIPTNQPYISAPVNYRHDFLPNDYNNPNRIYINSAPSIYSTQNIPIYQNNQLYPNYSTV